MKKIIIFILLLTMTTSVSASTNTQNRQELNNLGVNKHWTITEKNKQNVLNTYLVNANEKIYDFSEKISDIDEKIIYEKIQEFINKTNMDLAFITVNLPYSNDVENENYAADFYDYNDFGIDKENYSGILFFRNTYETDPYYDIYTFGNAQLYFNPQRYDNILDSVYNDIHSENYVEGINNLVNILLNFYNQGIPNDMKNYHVDKDGYLIKDYKTPWTIILIISTVITLITIIVLIKRNKMVKKKLETKDYLNPADLHIIRTKSNLINSYVTHYTSSSSSSGGGGGFSSHSGSSGGGHSSGGGRHG